MSIKEEMTSLCAGIILSQVKVRGRQTFISEDSGINRKYFNRRQFRLLRFHRLIRLLTAQIPPTHQAALLRIGLDQQKGVW